MSGIWVAICMNCSPTLPIPFGTHFWEDAGIADWVSEHVEATGHLVSITLDDRAASEN